MGLARFAAFLGFGLSSGTGSINSAQLFRVFPTSSLTRQDFIFPGYDAQLDFDYFLVQPMDGPSRDINTKLAIDWCKRHPKWRLSMQTHKYLNIP